MNAGHNSNADLKALGERINRMLDQAEDIKSDIAEIYKEAKSSGHDVKALREAVKRSREDADARKRRHDLEDMVDIYTKALGALADTPLGKSSIAGIIDAG